MSMQEFGQLIKQKYPQYQSIGDIQLAQKVIQKYPTYQSNVRTPQEEMTMAQQQGQQADQFLASPGQQLKAGVQATANAPVVKQAGDLGVGWLKGLLGLTADVGNAGQWALGKATGGAIPPSYINTEPLQPQGAVQTAGSFLSGFGVPALSGATMAEKAVGIYRSTPATLRKAAQILSNPATKELAELGTKATGLKTAGGNILRKITVEPGRRAVDLAKSLGKLMTNDWKTSLDNILVEQKKVYQTALQHLNTQRINGGAYKEMAKKDVDDLIKKIEGIQPEQYYARTEQSAKNAVESMKMWAADQMKSWVKNAKGNYELSNAELWKFRSQMDRLAEEQYKNLFDKKTLATDTYRQIRRIINEDIGTVKTIGKNGKTVIEELPKVGGKSFGDLLSYDHDLFDAGERIADKYVRKGIVAIEEQPKKVLSAAQKTWRSLPFLGGLGAGVTADIILQEITKLLGKK